MRDEDHVPKNNNTNMLTITRHCNTSYNDFNFGLMKSCVGTKMLKVCSPAMWLGCGSLQRNGPSSVNYSVTGAAVPEV